MKKLASEAGDKVLLRYLALYEKWQENSSQNRSQNCHTPSRHAKVVVTGKNWPAKHRIAKRRFAAKKGTQIRKSRQNEQ